MRASLIPQQLRLINLIRLQEFTYTLIITLEILFQDYNINLSLELK